MISFFFLISGFGFGLIYLPAIVSVGYYFENKRAFATGLAVCGSGLGAFIFNPLSKFLIDEFGWRGAILIEAGLILNCVICGAMFRPLVASKKSKNPKDLELQEVKKPDSKLIQECVEQELLIDSKSKNGVTSGSNGQTASPNHIVSQNNLLQPPSIDTAMFLSDGNLHRPAGKNRSPRSGEHAENGKPPVLRRLLSEEHHHHPHKHPHLTGRLFLLFCGLHS